MPDIDEGSTTPLRERAQFNEVQQQIVDFSNTNLAKFYDIQVSNWISKGAHGTNTDPIPDPPRKWAALPKTNLTSIEQDYDKRYSLPPMLVPTQTADPVVPKFVPPTPPPEPAGPIIGVSLGGGWFSAGYVVQGHEFQDRTPAGKTVEGTSQDGVSGSFTKYPAFVGPGWWLKVG